jgi:hypothetical protein
VPEPRVDKRFKAEKAAEREREVDDKKPTMRESSGAKTADAGVKAVDTKEEPAKCEHPKSALKRKLATQEAKQLGLVVDTAEPQLNARNVPKRKAAVAAVEALASGASPQGRLNAAEAANKFQRNASVQAERQAESRPGTGPLTRSAVVYCCGVVYCCSVLL